MSRLTGSRINGGNTAFERKESDFYPTPPDATTALIKSVAGNLFQDKSVWECACGEGHISTVFEKLGFKVISTDVSKICYGIGNCDFLNEKIRKADWIITNPPFNLSEKFIKHAIDLGGNFAFLLKSQYWHSKSRLSLFNKFKPAYVMPLTWRPDFLFGKRGGGSPLMDCIWCVWTETGSKETSYVPLAHPTSLMQDQLFAFSEA